MSRNKKRMIDALMERGFTGEKQEFQLFYWPHDGWYCNCDQLLHDWIGYNTPDVIREIEKGKYDDWLGEPLKYWSI